MEKYNLIENGKIVCPICNKKFNESEYLATAIDDMKVRWFANLVTHYRHGHISSWDKCWGDNGYNYRKGWFGGYEEEKEKVNERAKRQIIRKAKDTLKAYGITVSTLKGLEKNDDDTIKLASKLLEVA